MPEKEIIIGIAGGMGPEAGVNLFNSIITHTRAGYDQQHLSVVLMSFPKTIADRTAFLDGKVTVNPAYAVANIVQKLEAAGAGIIGLACNTVHAPSIYDVIVAELEKFNSKSLLLHMPYETCRFINEHQHGVHRVGLMTTNGTYNSGVYQSLLKQWGYEVVLPEKGFQHKVIHRMIYDPVFGIKSSPGIITREVNLLLNRAMAFFKKEKADAVILGCTELSLILKQRTMKGVVVIDSTEALAKALIRESCRSVNGHQSIVISQQPLISKSIGHLISSK